MCSKSASRMDREMLQASRTVAASILLASKYNRCGKKWYFLNEVRNRFDNSGGKRRTSMGCSVFKQLLRSCIRLKPWWSDLLEKAFSPGTSRNSGKGRSMLGIRQRVPREYSISKSSPIPLKRLKGRCGDCISKPASVTALLACRMCEKAMNTMAASINAEKIIMKTKAGFVVMACSFNLYSIIYTRSHLLGSSGVTSLRLFELSDIWKMLFENGIGQIAIICLRASQPFLGLVR